MDVLHLRTMARKSVMEFGKHSDKSVQQLLDIRETTYLRWVYFNCSMISFLDDILDELSIIPGNRIPKPGKDPELFDLITNEIWDHMDVSMYNVKKHLKKKSKCKARATSRFVKNRYDQSKAKMHRYNHGHR